MLILQIKVKSSDKQTKFILNQVICKTDTYQPPTIFFSLPINRKYISKRDIFIQTINFVIQNLSDQEIFKKLSMISLYSTFSQVQLIIFLVKKKISIITKMANKKDHSTEQSNFSLYHRPDSERNKIHHSETNQLQHFIKQENNLKKRSTFWNLMVDGRLETISGSINLFIFMMMISIGSSTYNGPKTNGGYILGWICIAQVSLIYLLLFAIKFIYIPSIEKEIQKNNSSCFKLYNDIFSGKKLIKNLNLQQLVQLEETVTQRSDLFARIFPTVQIDHVISQIKHTFVQKSIVSYQNNELKNLQLKEKNSIWWQNFWQVFVLGKTFTIPGVLLLVFIITPLTIATPPYTTSAINSSQGWFAIAFWALGIIIFIFIKLFIWDIVDKNVENARTSSFFAYRSVSLKIKQLNTLSLNQLEELEQILIKRQNQFHTCFPKQNPTEVLSEVKNILLQLLPKRNEQIDRQIKQIINKQKIVQNSYASWLNFFNLRLVTTIINSLKFMIVMAVTFISYYSQNTKSEQNAKIAIGSIGILVFVLGYLFYFLLKFYILSILEVKVHEARSSPFTTYRLVIFGHKNLDDLQIYQLEDISDGLNNRRQQFAKCFPELEIQTIKKNIQDIVHQKLSHSHSDHAYHLLKKQTQAQNLSAFWAGYVDGPFINSMYSTYVLIVLLIVTLTSLYEKVNFVMGYVGVAVFALLIIIVLFFKVFLIEHLTNNAKALHVGGYSEFKLVYNKSKELHDVQLSELQKIQNIIENNPSQFRRCFPKAALQSTLNSVKLLIVQKEHHQKNIRIRTAQEQVRNQLITLKLNRSKTALATWTNIIMDRLYVYIPVIIVIYILWVQTIGATLYGIAVCGFLVVASLSVIALFIILYNLFIQGHYQHIIDECERQLKIIEDKSFIH